MSIQEKIQQIVVFAILVLELGTAIGMTINGSTMTVVPLVGLWLTLIMTLALSNQWKIIHQNEQLAMLLVEED